MKIVLTQDLYLKHAGDMKLLAEAGDVLQLDDLGNLTVPLDDGFPMTFTVPPQFYRSLDH